MGEQLDSGGAEPQNERGVFPRRTFLRAAGMAALVGAPVLSRTDTMIGEIIWEADETSIREYEPFGSKDRLWLVLTAPGLGMKSGKYISKELSALGINSAFVELRNHDASIDQIARAAHETLRSAQSVRLVGASMGAPVLLEMMLRAAQHGVPKHIDQLVMVSSPFDIEDARYTPGARALDALYPWGYGGGPGGHTAYRLLADLQQGRLVSPQTEVEKINFEITKGNPISLTLSGIRMLSRSELALHTRKFVELGLITPDTEFLYVSTERGETDRVVDVRKAEQKWRTFVEALGARFIPVRIPDLQHGDVATALSAIAYRLAA